MWECRKWLVWNLNWNGDERRTCSCACFCHVCVSLCLCAHTVWYWNDQLERAVCDSFPLRDSGCNVADGREREALASLIPLSDMMGWGWGGLGQPGGTLLARTGDLDIRGSRAVSGHHTFKVHSAFTHSSPVYLSVLTPSIFPPAFMSSLLPRPSCYTSALLFSFSPIPSPLSSSSFSLCQVWSHFTTLKKLVTCARSRQLWFMHHYTRCHVLYFSLNNSSSSAAEWAIIDEGFSHRGTPAL